jgi:hypothetical protein
MTGANLVLQETRGTRKDRIGRGGPDDNEPNLIGRDARLAHCPVGRFLREIRRGNAGFDDVAFSNSCSLDDPLVGGIDHLLEVRVGQHARRNIGCEAGDPYRAKGCGSEDPSDGRVAHQSLSF